MKRILACLRMMMTLNAAATTSAVSLLGLLVALLGPLALTGCTQQQRPTEVIRDSGDRRFRAGDFAGARDDYSEIVANYPGDWEAQYRLGLALIETQQYPQARQALEIAYTLRPTQEVASAYAKALFLQRDESRLFAFLRERASSTRTTEAWLELGRYAMESNDPDTAKVAFDTAIEVDAGKTTAPYIEAAKLQERLGHLDEAIHRLAQAYGINQYDTRVHEMLRRLGEDPFKIKPLPPGR
jgi:tetratricopeptide (TPR) repeat protein